MGMSPELAGPKTATENVRIFPKSWSEAFSQALNEIRVPLSPTEIVVAGKSIAWTLAGCAVEIQLPGANKKKVGEARLYTILSGATLARPGKYDRESVRACHWYTETLHELLSRVPSLYRQKLARHGFMAFPWAYVCFGLLLSLLSHVVGPQTNLDSQRPHADLV